MQNQFLDRQDKILTHSIDVSTTNKKTKWIELDGLACQNVVGWVEILNLLVYFDLTHLVC